MKRFISICMFLILLLNGCSKTDVVYESGIYGSGEFEAGNYEVLLMSEGDKSISFYIDPTGKNQEILIGSYLSNTTIKFTNDPANIESIRVENGTFTLNKE